MVFICHPYDGNLSLEGWYNIISNCVNTSYILGFKSRSIKIHFWRLALTFFNIYIFDLQFWQLLLTYIINYISVYLKHINHGDIKIDYIYN